MRVIEIINPGQKSVLTVTRRSTPTPIDHQVLIKVAAAGINRPDVMQRKGLYPPPPDASDIPGLEIAGTIVAIGNHVVNLKVGDNVCALVTGGGYAEYCLADDALCLPIPENFSFIQAAALPETFFTVWNNIFANARLLPGETLLIHGGSSGIGTTAIQLAKAFSANVIITAGSPIKCSFCLQLGADAAINYKKQDFVDSINVITSNQGVDVILDMIGGDYFPRNLQCMARNGRLLQIAIQNGPKSEINLLTLMLKRLTIAGSTLRSQNIGFKSEIARQLLEKVWPLLSNDTIKPVIDSTFALCDAAQAHERMESSQHIGKIVLTV
ncbi:MAG: NAD(P)H-quinone oxidoreductase [Methylococcaceae bacterium]|nr:NAD(P)H-quinone oxidoreductase [Methylococcaceae bacterium]